MAIWKDQEGNLHDDMNGAALLLPSWPSNCGISLTPLTSTQVAALAASAQTAAQLAALAATYETAIAQPVSFTAAAGVTKTYQADPQSRQNVADMLNAYTHAGALPAGFYWVAEDNTQVPFTLADLQGLAAELGAQGWAAFQALQAGKKALGTA